MNGNCDFLMTFFNKKKGKTLQRHKNMCDIFREDVCESTIRVRLQNLSIFKCTVHKHLMKNTYLLCLDTTQSVREKD